MSEIKSVTEFGERPRRHCIWTPKYLAAIEHGGGWHPSPKLDYDILHFEEFTKAGHCGNVPWIRAYHRDKSTTDFNVALLTNIERGPTEREEP